ncbi:MAG: ornithine cyclodeaminase family protein [Actinomycetota bacterium]|nr:ornithine cyclodeaminase family protein [Actinomycetota bacterium]
MDLRIIGGDELARLLPMRDAIAALDRAFAAPTALPDRSHLDVGGGDLLVMPAWSDRTAGVKLVTVAPDNPERGLPLIHGVYVLFEKPGLKPVALFDAAPLTALRTAAVSGVATTYLASAAASRLVLFGAGVQANAHLLAMAAVLPLQSVIVVSRTPARAEDLVLRARRLGLAARVGEPADVARADIICTCTTSAEPLFDGSLVRDGAHVNAVGSYTPAARELDDRLITRANIFVDVETALQASGDLMMPVRDGVLEPARVHLLSQAVTGWAGRDSAEEITLFKSVGAAFEDLAVAEAAAPHLAG